MTRGWFPDWGTTPFYFHTPFYFFLLSLDFKHFLIDYPDAIGKLWATDEATRLER